MHTNVLTTTALCAALLAVPAVATAVATADVTPGAAPSTATAPAGAPMTASEPALAAEADTDADTDAGVEPMTSAVVEPLAGDGLGKFCVRVPVQALALAFANFFAAASLAKALPAAAPDQGQAPALSQLFGTSLPQDLTVLEAVPC